ncbi:MAG: hypothetical protein M1829_006494 [Trizodia sp. TS-e1964]|nr:MAG: hypothetical protein M1829_006494 [Trizodia sp. TS-e1964]
MNTRIEKTTERLKLRIEEGQYYEAHQQLRVVASRYAKQENYAAAIEILFSGAQSLLKAGQGGSGGDLCLFLLDLYQRAEWKPDVENRGKLLTLLRLFPAGEPSRKRFIGEIITWSSKFGEYPAGDPEVHHIAGCLYAEENEAYDAERHLALGTKDSPEHFARLEYEWYTQDQSHTAGLYAARAVFPYLMLGNLRDANRSLKLFTGKLTEENQGLAVQDISSTDTDIRIYPSLPLINFLNLLLVAAERGGADLFRQLGNQYGAHIQEAGNWDEALEQIGEMYFDIPVRRQANSLFDMMGGLFGGGGGGGVPAQPKSRRVEAPPPPTMDLD